MNPDYKAPELETKEVFGVTFEQKRNDIKSQKNYSTMYLLKTKKFPEAAKRDLLISLITLKYTQSNSVCYAKDGQAIGIGAGHNLVYIVLVLLVIKQIFGIYVSTTSIELTIKPDVRRPDRDNAIDVYISDEYMDLLGGDDWKRVFTEKPPVFTKEEKEAWLAKVKGVSLGSDAFFPFGDNIERAHKSGVEFVAQSGGSIRDDNVIETCDKSIWQWHLLEFVYSIINIKIKVRL